MVKRFSIAAFCLSILATGASLAQSKEYEITTVLKEKFYDTEGKPLTGKGVTIGDVDSGIDIFHPMFFFADGGEFDWIDADGDGKFTPEKDAVDFNKDGAAENEEILRYIEIRDNTYGMLPGIDKRNYNPEYDFLYIDRNGNKRRDFGPGAGFKEEDPTYGEQLFITIDANKNGKLDTGEKLAALKTSKVRAIMEKNGTIRRRGVDLIYAEDDSSGHGTGVAGLMLGGHYGVQKVHGIAPDAEIIVASVRYNYTPRFVTNFPELVKFLRDEKVNILLFEDGEWVYEFMDGSTEEEEIVNQLARDGFTIVGGGGNLASGRMHLKDTLNQGEKATYTLDCPEYNAEGNLNNGVFVSFLWPNSESNLSFVVETPERKRTAELTSGSEFLKVGLFNVAYAKEISPKGTSMFRFGLSRSDSGTVLGRWKFTVNASTRTIIDGFTVDVSQSWSGSSHWTSHVTDEGTVTFPSTADSCIAVGAYVVNFGFFEKPGDLADYSGRGYNITGKLGIDICGPGHITFTTEKDYGWMTFSGTSSAAPHVAGLAALMLSYNPSLTHTQIREIILRTASKDRFTGEVPNTNWGYGKLNMEAALRELTGK
jgi:subtilisin family serine protease